jgi:AcrR family transcriptional regulator
MPTDPALAALIEAADSLAEGAARRRLGDRPAAARTEVRRILDAALELLRGGAELRIAAVVRTARVSNDAFYRAFRGKAELLAAVADDSARQLLTDLRQAMTGDPADQVRTCVRVVLARASRANAPTTRAVLRHTPRPGNTLPARLATLLADPLARLGATTTDALTTAGTILAVMEHHLWADQPPRQADEDALCRYVLRAVTR